MSINYNTEILLKLNKGRMRQYNTRVLSKNIFEYDWIKYLKFK